MERGSHERHWRDRTAPVLLLACAVAVAAACGAEGGATTPPPEEPPPSNVAECASPAAAWIWCDDFESDRLASYFEVNTASGNFGRASGVGRESSFGIRGRWTAGASNAGALHLAFGQTPQAYMDPVDAGTTKYRDIYWRFYVRRQAGWTGGGGDKLTRAHIFASPSSFAQAFAAHVWSSGTGHQFLALDPASGTDEAGTLQTTSYNDPNLRYLGLTLGTTPLFSTANANRWYCVEARLKLNDAGSSNGEFHLWIDGAVEASQTGRNFIGAYDAYGINAIYLENFWNDGSPVEQERYFDNFVVSTARIGC